MESPLTCKGFLLGISMMFSIIFIFIIFILMNLNSFYGAASVQMLKKKKKPSLCHASQTETE